MILKEADCRCFQQLLPPLRCRKRLCNFTTVSPDIFWKGDSDPIDLTKREEEVLRCLTEGMSTASISSHLVISPVTVRNHVSNILHKLDVHTKLAAVAFAHQNHLI